MNWYYKADNSRIGPLTEEQIRELAHSGVIGPDTEVWNEQIGRWKPYRDVPGFSLLHGQSGYAAASSASSHSVRNDPMAPGTSGEGAADIPLGCCNECEREVPQKAMTHTIHGLLCPDCMAGLNREAEAHAAAPSLLPRYSPAQTQTHAFEFTGSGGEYFRIWIVNLLLSLLTLGIYSAWAKVRKNQYFYRHMRVAGSTFDYHGNPIAILKGRIIAFVLFFALQYTPNFNMYLYYFFLVVFIVVFPLLLTRSFAFRLHNTSWRNIRFRFHGTAKDAAMTIYGYGILIPLSFGLCYPLFYHRVRAFLFNHSAFGKTRARLDITSRPVYGIFLKSAGVGIAVGLIVVLAGSIIGGVMSKATSPEYLAIRFGIIGAASYICALFIIYPFFQSSMTNLFWNNIRLGAASFTSEQGTGSLARLLLSNAFLTLVTLGLYWPWAAVRMARYRAETLSINTELGVDHFVGDAETDMAATGEEVTDAFDFDISF